MTTGVKTALIVGGVAVGVVILFKALSGPNVLPAGAKPKANTDLLSLQGLLTLGSMFGNAGGSGPGAPKPLNQGTYVDLGSSVSYRDYSSGATDVISKDFLPETETI